MKKEKRLIDAYTLAEEIESLAITVAGKPAKWNDAKHSVLCVLAEQPDVDAVVLPCKIGDEFWTDYVGLTKVKCSMLTQKANGTWLGRFTVENGWGSSINRPLDEIGKTLFRTKEEAAEAIAEKAQKEITMNPDFSFFNSKAYEVIGNIHDNPDLLKRDTE